MLFGTPPVGLVDHEIVARVLADFNVPLLGEFFAGKCLCHMVVGLVDYPDAETTQHLVGRAEAFLSELFADRLPAEPHMAEIEWLERLLDGVSYA